MIRAAALVAGIVALAGACDALVGGRCQVGYVEQAGACVPAATASSAAGGNNAGASSTGGSSAGGSSAGGAGGSSASGPTASGGSGGGGGGCPAPLTPCPDGCVDLQTNPNNCGMCGIKCPTEICIGGKCTGGPVGHLVIIAMSYAQYNAPSQRLLGNAVFLPGNQPLPILDYRKHTKAQSAQSIDNLIAAEATTRGRTFTVKKVTTAPELSAELDSGKHALLFIHDQPTAPSGELFAFGAAIASSVNKFANQGGTVVVLASADGVGQMPSLLTSAGILTTLGLADATAKAAINQVPTDVVGVGVQSPFLAKSISATIATSEPPGALAAYVVTDTALQPMVIHKITNN